MGLSRGVDFVDLACQGCRLSSTRTQVVPAEGGRRPLAFFVGEAPGPQEDQQGRPFVGRAGRILRETLRRAGWSDEEVWITNAVKCFPHEARDGKKKIRAPRPDESEACRAHLRNEIIALHPRLIVALGRTAASAVLDEVEPSLEAHRGRVVAARTDLGAAVLVTYHPSGLHYSRDRAAAFESDLVAARRIALGVERP